MCQTCLMKFSQNLHLKNFLLKTKDSRMVEASPTNKRWGVGLNIKSPETFDPQHWNGQNWMCEILDRVKSVLK